MKQLNASLALTAVIDDTPQYETIFLPANDPRLLSLIADYSQHPRRYLTFDAAATPQQAIDQQRYQYTWQTVERIVKDAYRAGRQHQQDESAPDYQKPPGNWNIDETANYIARTIADLLFGRRPDITRQQIDQ